MRQFWFACAGDFGSGALGKRLAQFHAPLIEGVDVPNGALRKYAVLVQSDESTERMRSKTLSEDGIARPIAFEAAMRDQCCGRSFCRRLRLGFSECQRFALREQVRHQQIMLFAQRIQRSAKTDEVARNQLCALMNQLVERMLAIRPGFAPVDRSGLVIHAITV